MTSIHAAWAIALAAPAGLLGLVLMPAFALKSARDACCPQRAARELAEGLRTEVPAGKSGHLVRQRSARETVNL